MFDFEPWMHPQTLTCTFALFGCPHWQHHSWCISWVYGSYLCSQGISEEVELGKKPWNRAQITPPPFTTLVVFQGSALFGPGVFIYQRRNNNMWLVALQGLTVITKVCVHAAQLCSMLCDFINCHPWGFSVHGIFQARILEWVAISSSRLSSWPRDRTRICCVSCLAGRFFTTAPSYKD